MKIRFTIRILWEGKKEDAGIKIFIWLVKMSTKIIKYIDIIWTSVSNIRNLRNEDKQNFEGKELNLN